MLKKKYDDYLSILNTLLVLVYENDKHAVDGYINTCIASDVDFRNFTSRYLMTFAGKQFHNNQCCKNINLT